MNKLLPLLTTCILSVIKAETPILNHCIQEASKKHSQIEKWFENPNNLVSIKGISHKTKAPYHAKYDGNHKNLNNFRGIVAYKLKTEDQEGIFSYDYKNGSIHEYKIDKDKHFIEKGDHYEIIEKLNENHRKMIKINDTQTEEKQEFLSSVEVFFETLKVLRLEQDLTKYKSLKDVGSEKLHKWMCEESKTQKTISESLHAILEHGRNERGRGQIEVLIGEVKGLLSTVDGELKGKLDNVIGKLSCDEGESCLSKIKEKIEEVKREVKIKPNNEDIMKKLEEVSESYDKLMLKDVENNFNHHKLSEAERSGKTIGEFIDRELGKFGDENPLTDEYAIQMVKSVLSKMNVKCLDGEEEGRKALGKIAAQMFASIEFRKSYVNLIAKSGPVDYNSAQLLAIYAVMSNIYHLVGTSNFDSFVSSSLISAKQILPYLDNLETKQLILVNVISQIWIEIKKIDGNVDPISVLDSVIPAFKLVFHVALSDLRVITQPLIVDDSINDTKSILKHAINKIMDLKTIPGSLDDAEKNEIIESVLMLSNQWILNSINYSMGRTLLPYRFNIHDPMPDYINPTNKKLLLHFYQYSDQGALTVPEINSLLSKPYIFSEKVVNFLWKMFLHTPPDQISVKDSLMLVNNYFRNIDINRYEYFITQLSRILTSSDWHTPKNVSLLVNFIEKICCYTKTELQKYLKHATYRRGRLMIRNPHRRKINKLMYIEGMIRSYIGSLYHDKDNPMILDLITKINCVKADYFANFNDMEKELVTSFLPNYTDQPPYRSIIPQ